MCKELLWKKFPISNRELSLSKVLRCGQTFRWKNINNTWTFTTRDKIVLLKQDETHIHYTFLQGKDKTVDVSKGLEETYEFVKDYFNLSVNLESLYEQWIKQDILHKGTGKSTPFNEFTGIRILRQDPWETLISFICSSNNNVKRISKMCDALCENFGTYLNEHKGLKHYTFPTAEDLSKSPSTEKLLRELGFGYRAKFIYQTACQMTGPELPTISLEKLYALRHENYETAHEFLLKLMGVGPKVADCICLMALDKHDIVPIDTHVYQIAVRDYKFKGKKDVKALNKNLYQSIRGFFKLIFGQYAGWAQSVLFTADLVDLNNGINQTVEIKSENISKENMIRSEPKIEIK